MDNAQKAIMIGVGLFITIIIISAVLLIVNLGTNVTDEATNELGSMSSTMKNQITQKYDKTVLTGSEVRAAFQQYQNSNNLCVVMVAKVDPTRDDNTTFIGPFYKSGVIKKWNKFQIVMGTGAKAIVAISNGIVGKNDLKLNYSNNYPLIDFSENYKWGKSTDTYTYPKATSALWNDSSNEYCYINPSKQYNSSLIKDKKDQIVGIVFQLKED